MTEETIWGARCGTSWTTCNAIILKDVEPQDFFLDGSPGILVSDLFKKEGPYEIKDEYYD